MPSLNDGDEEIAESDIQNMPGYKKFRDATMLYRSVANRMRMFPIFLQRTLHYLRRRYSRPRKRNTPFDYEKFFKGRPPVQPKEQAYLTITYIGFYTNSSLANNETVRMETVLSKKRGGRKRGKNKPHVRVSAGVCEVYVNPEPDDTRPVPIISIPPDMLNLDSSTMLLAKSLIIRAVVDANNGEEFECEQILVNENGTCPLAAGDYEMTATTKCPNTWTKTKGCNEEILNTPVELPRLSFRLEWTANPSSGWVPKPDPIVPKSMSGKRGKGAKKENLDLCDEDTADDSNALYVSRPEQIYELIVVYSFVWDNYRMDTFLEADNFMCPWCDLNCLEFYGLFKHLKISHERFLFNFTKTGQHLQVDIKLNDKADINYSGDPNQAYFSETGPRRTSPYLEVLVWGKTRRPRPQSMDRLLERQCIPDCTVAVQTYGHSRMYYHSSTCLPIHPCEMGEDSENERDPKWLRQKTAMMIDDFTDVNEGEKEVIKMWNLHVLKQGYVGDLQRPKANKDFYKANASELIEKNLYKNGFLHLINQNHFNLVGAVHAYRIYRPVLESLKVNLTAIERYRENYLKERAGWIASGGEGGSRDKAKEEFQSQSGPSTSSTFVTGDGTLRRKMTQPANPKPMTNGKPKVAQTITKKKYCDEFCNKFQMRSDTPEKDRSTRKRKLSLEDSANSNPARRSRCGSDPVESRNKKKQVMRKTAH